MSDMETNKTDESKPVCVQPDQIVQQVFWRNFESGVGRNKDSGSIISLACCWKEDLYEKEWDPSLYRKEEMK
jgi:hypothetical protein